MKNVKLLKGICPLCGDPIAKEWAGERPALGTKCEKCWHAKREVFGPENVKIKVKKQIRFDPVFGIYEYDFDWQGTKIKVNDEIGIIGSPQADGDFVNFQRLLLKKWGEKAIRAFLEKFLTLCWTKFPFRTSQLFGKYIGKVPQLGTFIKGVGYWDLLRIYQESGGNITPPPLKLAPYTPKLVKLLAEPIAYVVINRGKKGVIFRVEVLDGKIWVRNIPVIRALHALANNYVKFKFNLEPNFCCEGGFLGNGFEVRNCQSGIGLSVETRYPFNGRKKPPDLEPVISAWTTIMTTLLSYPWHQEQLKTAQDAWRCYGTIQDILRNILTQQEVRALLEYTKKHRLRHYGYQY